MTEITLYRVCNSACLPERRYLARLERGTTATVVWGSTEEEARSLAEAAVRDEEALIAKQRAAYQASRSAAPATKARRAETKGLGAKHAGAVDEVEAPSSIG